MRLSKLAVLVVPLALLAACGGDDDEPALGGDVVGTWRELPNATYDEPPTIEERELAIFTADGRLTLQRGTSTVGGAYSLDGGDILMHEDGAASPVVLSVPYLATADRFVFGALLPLADHDGPVADWHLTRQDEGQQVDVDIAIRADGTAHYAIASDEPVAWDGTWRAVGDDVELTLVADGDRTVTIRGSVYRGTFGALYEKLP